MTIRFGFRGELLGRLDELLDDLVTAGERFDQGRLIEAKVMAIHLRKLLHEAVGSHALIQEFGLQHRLTWVDTAGVPNPKVQSSAACLTLMNVRKGAHAHGEYVPKFSLYPPAPIRTRSGGHIDRGSRIPFEHWWTNPVVKDADGAEYSRKQLVLALTERGPDGRLDPETAAAYDALVDSASLGGALLDETPSPATLTHNPVMASVRQISYEVLQSITQQRDIIDGVGAA